MYIDVPYKIDIRKGIMPIEMKQPLYFAEENAHRIAVTLVDGMADVDLDSSVECNGHIIIRNTNQTIVGIAGTIEVNEQGHRNKCTLVLPKEAYAVAGPINIVMNLVEQTGTDGEGEPVYSVTTILSLNCTVRSTLTGMEIVIDGSTIPSLDVLVAQIQTMRTDVAYLEEHVNNLLSDVLSEIDRHAIRYDAAQPLLTSSQKTQARVNIDVDTASVRGTTLVIAEASAADAEIIDVVTGETPVIEAVKNHRYICEDDLTSLSFTPCASGLCEVVFHSSSDDILTVTEAVMPDWWTETEAGYTYEMSFADGFGAVMIWTTPS